MLDTFFILGASDLVGDLANTASEIQKNYGFDTKYFIAQVVNFLIVAFLLYRFAFKPVLATLDERQKKIDDGLRFADEMKHKLNESEIKYSQAVKQGSIEAQKIVEEAKEHAKHSSEKQTQDTIAQVEQMLTNARQAAVQEHDRMLAEVRKEVAQLVVATTARVLKQELTDADKKRYNESAVRDLASKN